MRYRTVLIDLDGTLVDAFTTIHRSYVHALPQFGYPAPTMAEVRAAVGGGLDQAIARFVPRDLIAQVRAVHMEYSQRILLEDVTLFRGGRELLEALNARGVVCAVFTNKHGPSARRICAHLGVMPLLRGVYGAGDTAWLKPQPEFAGHVLRELGAEAATTCLIGDSPFDVEAALNAGLGFAGVTTGTHSAEQLKAAGGEAVFADLEEIAQAWRLD
ncbi:MAG TPA: HAD family hydrolase [Opitutaceae bacterium]